MRQHERRFFSRRGAGAGLGVFFGLVLAMSVAASARAQYGAPASIDRSLRRSGPPVGVTNVSIMPQPNTVSIPSVGDTARSGRTYRSKRLWWGMGTTLVLDAGSMVALHRLWYGNTEQARWHWYDQPGGRAWYDDWFTYVQQDKLGHVYAAWALTRAGIGYGRWSGLSRRGAALLGMGASTFFQAQIEFFDGFAEAYGGSRTDLLANAAGSALAGAQFLYPDATDWFALKYSYHPSPYYDPSRHLGNAIQDYQGITYWVSLRPGRLLPERAAVHWPDGLALSVGHSGTGLERAVSGFDGSPEHRRQLFVGLDLVVGELIDLPKALRPLEEALSFVRLPLPALQVHPTTRWHWVYF